MNKLTKNLAALGLSAALLLPMAALADSVDVSTNFNALGSASGLQSGETSLPQVIGKVINVGLGLMGIILVIIVIWAGFKWMMARGNDKDVAEAKTMITNAVIGMIILMASYAIAKFVLDSIGTATGTYTTTG